MIETKSWMEQAVCKLREAFGPRLLFVGLQGSYVRLEATPESDIDIQIVLDTLAVEDLKRCRALLRALPEGEKACGFAAGREELRHWPAHEMFAFTMDTKAYYGSLDGLVPAFGREDIRRGVHIGAANLYHAAAHLYVAGGAAERAAGLPGLLKSAFFLLLSAEYLRSGQYAPNKAALARRLAGNERELLRLAADREALAKELQNDPDALFARFLDCGGKLLTGI